MILRPFQRLLTVFMVLFIGVSGTMVYWQVGQARKLTNSPYNPRQCVQGNVPQRGTIYDRTGVKLAYSVPDSGSPCGWKRVYTDTTLSPLIGYFDPYGFGVTGLEAAYNDILSGQQTAPATDIVSGLKQTLHQIEHLKTYGNDIYLTIDERIQQEAYKDYDNARLYGCGTDIDSHSPLGSIIVEDPKTGELLAYVSHPSFDNNTLVNHSDAPDGAKDQNGIPLTVGEEYFNALLNDPNKPLINRPVSDLLVPGSSFKTLTLIAGLDSNTDTLDTALSQSDSLSYLVDGFNITTNNLEYYPPPESTTFPMDIVHQFAYSNNVAFARFAVGEGANTWLQYASRFGISYGNTVVNLPFDVPVAHSWAYRPGSTFDTVALANAGYGQASLQITPLVMSVMVSAVAADGKEFAPHVLLKAVNYGQNAADTPAQTPQLLQQAMSAQSAQGVRLAMRAVVEYGSVGASPGLIGTLSTSPTMLGGKTGTGQLGSGSYSQQWFVSLAPDDTANPVANPPRLVVIVQKEKGGEGACAAPIADKIDQVALPLVGYPINK